MTLRTSSLLFFALLAAPQLALAQEEQEDEAAPASATPEPQAAPVEPRVAAAEPEATPAEEEGPKMNLTVAPPGPALQRTAFVHEGFYLRVNVGPGVLWSNVNDKTAANVDASGTGFAFGADLFVGGSPSPGIALGLGALTNIAFGLDLKDSADRSVGSGSHFHFIVGPFFDAFPNDKRGFHLGAALGFAGTTLDNGPNVVSSAFGGGAAAWLGYDMWVAPEWSAGAQLRGSGAFMGASDAEVAAFGLNLLITVLNH